MMPAVQRTSGVQGVPRGAGVQGSTGVYTTGIPARYTPLPATRLSLLPASPSPPLLLRLSFSSSARLSPLRPVLLFSGGKDSPRAEKTVLGRESQESQESQESRRMSENVGESGRIRENEEQG